MYRKLYMWKAQPTQRKTVVKTEFLFTCKEASIHVHTPCLFTLFILDVQSFLVPEYWYGSHSYIIQFVTLLFCTKLWFFFIFIKNKFIKNDHFIHMIQKKEQLGSFSDALHGSDLVYLWSEWLFSSRGHISNLRFSKSKMMGKEKYFTVNYYIYMTFVFL